LEHQRAANLLELISEMENSKFAFHLYSTVKLLWQQRFVEKSINDEKPCIEIQLLSRTYDMLYSL